jgi:hypothetical protein
MVHHHRQGITIRNRVIEKYTNVFREIEFDFPVCVEPTGK